MATFIDRFTQASYEPTTINSPLRRLRAAFGWAEQQGIINTVPKFKMLPAGKGKEMRNRQSLKRNFRKCWKPVKPLGHTITSVGSDY